MTEAQRQQRDLRAAEQRLRDGDLTQEQFEAERRGILEAAAPAPTFVVGERVRVLKAQEWVDGTIAAVGSAPDGSARYEVDANERQGAVNLSTVRLHDKEAFELKRYEVDSGGWRGGRGGRRCSCGVDWEDRANDWTSAAVRMRWKQTACWLLGGTGVTALGIALLVSSYSLSDPPGSGCDDACRPLEGSNDTAVCEYCTKWGCATVAETDYQCAAGWGARMALGVAIITIGGMFGVMIGLMHCAAPQPQCPPAACSARC